MSRAAFQTSPLISFSHFPRGTRSYITASLALRSRQHATNHTEVNKHIARLRQDEYSTITPNTTVVLMMNKFVMETAHSALIFWIGPFSKLAIQLWYCEATSGFGPANGAFGNSRFQSSSFYYYFFFGDTESYYHSHLQWHWSALWLILPMHSVTLIAHCFFIYLFISFGETSGTFDKISPHSPSLNSSGWLLPPAPAVNLYIELFFCLVHGGVG